MERVFHGHIIADDFKDLKINLMVSMSCSLSPLNMKILSNMQFLSSPVLMHGGLLCIAFCPSVCGKNSLEKNHILKSIRPRVLKFGTEVDLDDL